MDNKPNLFIIGAPKCGTTSVAYWLNQCKDVFLPKVKEPHFFNYDEEHWLTKELSDYHSLFDTENQESYRYYLDASVWYLYSENAVNNIEEYTSGRAKYIVCLRNPVEMAVALHAEQVLGGNENEKDFSTAWKLQDERRLGHQISSQSHAPSHLLYKEACSLGKQCQRLLNSVDQSRVFFIFLDDLKERPFSVFQDLFSFLDLEYQELDFTPQNTSKVIRLPWLHKLIFFLATIRRGIKFLPRLGVLSYLKNKNIKSSKRAEVSSDILAEVRSELVDEIKELENLFGRDLSHWK